MRGRAFSTRKVRSYQDGSLADRSAVTVTSDRPENAVLHLARLTGALRRYERVTRRRVA